MAKKRGRRTRGTGKPATPRPRRPPVTDKPAAARPQLPSLLDEEEGPAGGWSPAAPARRAVSPAPSPTSAFGTEGSTAERRRRRTEDDVTVLVNERRRVAGLPPLRIDERLRQSSRAHSEDMAARDFFSHEDPAGVSPADRMSAAGYPAPAAENIARGQPGPAAAMRAWMNSPGHRRNILRVGVTTIGVGVHFGPGGPWWTQNFGYEP
ncbi:CAP domain-containing protein [Streptomyces wedmorensis]|uniref:CAP domain-containing protein n=1 Tax=Streptomyces wedmorensis TaxID=43759 RepID=UPI0037AC0641